MSVIFIENLHFEAIIGILDFERNTPQPLIIDIKMDAGDEFIDYSKIAEIAENTVKTERFGTIESALAHLEATFRELFELKYLYIKIAKPAILKNAIAGAILERRYC